MQKSTQQNTLETYIELISGYIPELFRYILIFWHCSMGSYFLY